ncbi:MAG: transposase [Candidatus Helarchaeota archaeon]
MKRNDAAYIILTIDSSLLKARENDPSLSEDTKENINRKKTHKIHADCDWLGILLQIHRTQGEMNDKNGFELYKESLIRLKEIAKEEGILIIRVVIDAGFASKKIIS